MEAGAVATSCLAVLLIEMACLAVLAEAVLITQVMADQGLLVREMLVAQEAVVSVPGAVAEAQAQ